MLTEISVRIFGLLIGDIIRFICLVLLRIFDDFRKVFDAVLQLADSLLCFLPGGGCGGDFLFQFFYRASFIICLCRNL